MQLTACVPVRKLDTALPAHLLEITMTDRIRHVANPLTVIALFATITEVGATTALPFISEAQQAVFIWFLMAFPTCLVLAFFFVLLKKHTVLYAPSDFRGDDAFLRASKVRDNQFKSVKAEGIIFGGPPGSQG